MMEINRRRRPREVKANKRFKFFNRIMTSFAREAGKILMLRKILGMNFPKWGEL